MSTRATNRFLLLTILSVLVGASRATAEERIASPTNAPAAVDWNADTGQLRLRYHDGTILDATVRAEDAEGNRVEGVAPKLEPADSRDEKDKVEQRLKFVLAKPKDGVQVVLRGTVTGSEEVFPAETDSEAQKRFPCVRNSVGLSRNLRNNAVYDRRWDWVLARPGGRRDTHPAQARREGANHVFLGEPRIGPGDCLPPSVLPET